MSPLNPGFFYQVWHSPECSPTETIYVIYQLPVILTALSNVVYMLSHGMCLYQVITTLHVLNDVANDAESTQKKSKIT